MGELTDPELLGSSRVDVLDVRPIVDRGEEPFGTIDQRLQDLPDDNTLVLVAPFDPRPLKQYVTREGYVFDYWEPSDTMTWMAIFRGDERELPSLNGDGPGFVLPIPGGFQYILDCRSLGPPRPLEWTGEVLERLNEGDLLVQHNDRRPAMLLDNLEGFDWETEEVGDRVRVEFRAQS